ncbi:hypothetical protein QR680_000478 [Steinernema hermaphroditum]|uniref:Thioredoxin n=1 Tax=Steinernema hermaphroditum TaxID=289476 RepID=A0AA39LEC7_9BILA|nr:hypothetical protein QR680_000478 [Steinernema hermaphroditum]
MVVKRPETKTEFDAILEEAGDSLVIVDFFATWCGPCKLMTPKFHKMSDEFTNATFVMIDVDEQDDICEDYEIKVMPTFVFVKSKKQIHVVEGNVVDELRKAIEENL